jgi:uncharacterized protein
MSYAPLPFPERRTPKLALGWIIAAIAVLLFFSRTISSWIIDYFWWQEMGQVPTWLRMVSYRYLPGLAAWVIVFAVLWIAHARGMHHAGEKLSLYRQYARLSALALAVASLILALSTIDGWTIARYVGGRGAQAASIAGWADPVFGKPLPFYFFYLPFYNMLLNFLATCAFAGALVYYVAARGWQLRRDVPGFKMGQEIDLGDLRRLGRLESGLFKGLAALFLVSLAAKFWLGRYELLLSDHGNLMVGIDYVQQNLGLPLQIAKAVAALLAGLFVLLGRNKLAIACVVVLAIDAVLPAAVGALYVRPNELTLEKPYIQRHLEATRAAYGLDRRARDVNFPAQKEGRIDFAANRTLLDNVRLWDWRAFHDTLSQSQPLRPYTYSDTDVDRYQIDGRLRQTLLAPRELDLSQLGDARNRWINRSLTFTHGYGLALAEANRITDTGLPELLIRNAPVEVKTKSLQVTRPEIYYGETPAESVIVRTSQQEYNYPSGSSEVNTTYAGKGGFLIASMPARIIAAVAEGEGNIVLTNSIKNDSRMMIRRQITERLSELAPFLGWDQDPYMVITSAGKLVWIVDGYLTSDAHPYSRGIAMEGLGRFNYIRNSVKATVDAYDGDVHLYVADVQDPLIGAYQSLFPELFAPIASMPADLRSHTRVPEMMFQAQAEMYRTYHMRDPESFYNRADLWDLATYTSGAEGQPMSVPATYMIAELPGEKEPEFLLMTQFTPRNKQNLIGVMVARSDGEHLGELVYLQLPKQEVIQGPLQVEALINQDQNISKDLTLWNQQGSKVLRSQILTLPIDNTFLYVAPIYIQAAQARMPQLKKVALVRGSNLVYADTYEQALAELQALQGGKQIPITNSEAVSTLTTTSTATAPSDPRLDTIRSHLQRYRELSSQGKWAEAGKELEAIESTVKK